ncbi:hypothetical protein [Sediminicola sp. 1XM1-17]|uniref:hypothetical protein n=1 Tax=Sediminicola sp. 1XM1-17 TaxID=3127702 RepID=UPI0030781828
MDVINEIIQESPIGTWSLGYKSAILLLFSSIVITLFCMLVLLLKYGPQMTIVYGY